MRSFIFVYILPNSLPLIVWRCIVYYNQPARALDLITRFILGETLLDVGLPSYPPVSESQKFKWNNVWQVALGVAVGAAMLFVCHRLRNTSDRRGKYETLNSNDGMTNYQTN